MSCTENYILLSFGVVAICVLQYHEYVDIVKEEPFRFFVEIYPGAIDSDTFPELVSGSVVVELSPAAPKEVPCGAIGAVVLPALVAGSVVVELSPSAPKEVPCGAIGAVVLPALCAVMDWPKIVIRPSATIGRINIAMFILSIYNRYYKTLVFIIWLVIMLNQGDSIG
jgi:hypothetical protein